MNSSRKPNLTLCYALIGLGVFIMLGTVLAAAVLKVGIVRRVGEPPRADSLSDGFKVASLDRQIKSKERDIELTKKAPDFEDIEKKAREQLEKASGKKTSAANANAPANSGESKAAEIKKLEDEKQQLIVKKNELIGQQRAKEMKPRTWSEWVDDYELELLLGGVLPLAVLTIVFGSLTFGRWRIAENPLALTDFEGRCILFPFFAVVFSAFGFFLFVWILSIVY